MQDEIDQGNGYTKAPSQNPSQQGAAGTMPNLTTVPTSVTLSAEQFERIYLNPMMRRQPALTKQLGNPTPLGLGGFVITTTPLACCLMGWRGAELNGVAFTGSITFLGGMLLVLTSILEFILGNTFPCVVFGTIGAFWFAFATSMTPAFNAAAPYSSTANTAQGLTSPGFMNTYAFLFLSMAILMLIFMICATRVNVVFVLIFASLFMVLIMLSAGYWTLGRGDAVVGNRCVVGGGASLFVSSLLGFYLLIVQLFDSVGFPVTLPVGDLSQSWPGPKKQSSEQDPELAASNASFGEK